MPSDARRKPTLLLAIETGISASCPWARGTRTMEPALILARDEMRLMLPSASTEAPVCSATCASVTVSEGTHTVQLAS